ncbi:LysR family transcriptional regulator [Pseudomonas sp. M47T1]|uniref:LysR substrate-binding domain-containing protein n=1 Tax=unclassified Pseudomonas TaxID=196821 RepID=UPI00026089A1|nr:LysR substrate-binding domain-containing protein [Pseudomonas sp. M47T1]EIK95834.1 LysR family transcriptional regulator [Pseudomonas sp. M47T1]
MVRLPPLIALRAFEATARFNSVGKAATALNVTHPAISHQLRQLEAWFDTPLLTREGRGIRLTETGEQLSVSLTDAFGRIDRACARVNAQRAQPPLVLACIASVASRWLIAHLPQFTDANPGVPLRLVYATRHSDTLAGDMDLAIIDCDGAYQGDLQAWPLFSGATLPVCSPALITRGQALQHPEDLLGAQLLHDADASGWQQWFAHAGVTQPPGGGLIFRDFNLMSTAAIAGHGVALCPVALIQQDLRLGLLKVLSPISANTERQYLVVHRHDCDSRVIALRDWLLAQARSVSAPA